MNTINKKTHTHKKDGKRNNGQLKNICSATGKRRYKQGSNSGNQLLSMLYCKKYIPPCSYLVQISTHNQISTVFGASVRDIWVRL